MARLPGPVRPPDLSLSGRHRTAGRRPRSSSDLGRHEAPGAAGSISDRAAVRANFPARTTRSQCLGNAGSAWPAGSAAPNPILSPRSGPVFPGTHQHREAQRERLLTIPRPRRQVARCAQVFAPGAKPSTSNPYRTTPGNIIARGTYSGFRGLPPFIIYSFGCSLGRRARSGRRPGLRASPLERDETMRHTTIRAGLFGALFGVMAMCAAAHFTTDDAYLNAARAPGVQPCRTAHLVRYESRLPALCANNGATIIPEPQP